MIRNARAITRRDGEALWPGFARIPFHMILVERTRETLFCHAPLAGFRPRRADPITGCTMQYRPRLFDVDSSAALGVADEPAMIVHGVQPQFGAGAAAWMVEIGHEAFHQYQARLPGYAAKVAALGLSGDGSSGQWMLDYPFPYGEPRVATAFGVLCTRALAFLGAATPSARRAAIADYVLARRAARATVSPAEWRYYEFQIGQEGIARWTELMLAQAAARRDPRFGPVARDRVAGIATSMTAIGRQGLKMWKRSAFYVLGTAEAMILDTAGPGWRAVYRERPFSMGEQLDALAR